ncbi:MAG: BadF/BadG/BcrA/BcrD ATPase family protein [Burkholderiaceae bacterium]
MSPLRIHNAFEASEIRFVVAVDGGGTGTRARAWTRAGAPIGGGEAGPSALAHGIGQAWLHVGQAIERAFASAGAPLPNRGQCALGLGLAGALAPHFAESFIRAAPDYGLIALENDSRTALMGAHAGRPGSIVAVGTGAVGEALHPDGRRIAVSGWGFPVGDEGSGAWLGSQAMRRAHRALDGRAPAGPLARAVWRRVGGGRDELLDWCARAGQHDYAQLAPLVFECADTDDAASSLLRGVGREIEDIARALDPGRQLPIALLGSIGRRMADRLPAALRAHLVDAAGDAVDGAHQLACRQLERAGR